MIPPTFRNSAITRLEFAHLRRLEEQPTWLNRMGAWLVKGALVGWALFVAFVLLAAGQRSVYQLLEENPAVLFLVLILIPITLTAHFATVFRTLFIASETVMREKRCKTWESLVLTTIDARQVILGKWWAAVRVVWRDYVLLAALRAGAVVLVGTTLDQQIFTLAPFPTSTSRILLAVLFIVLFTFLNGIFTAAAGILGGLLTSRSEGIATPMALATRMTVVLVPSVLLLVFGLYLIYAPSGPHIDGDTLRPLLLSVLCLVDNGLLGSAALANSLDPTVILYGLVALAGMLLYGGLTLGLLAAGQFAAQKQGMLSPQVVIDS